MKLRLLQTVVTNFGISMIILNEKVTGSEYNILISRQRQLHLYNLCVEGACMYVRYVKNCKHTPHSQSVSQLDRINEKNGFGPMKTAAATTTIIKVTQCVCVRSCDNVFT